MTIEKNVSDIAIIMGSASDNDVMCHSAAILKEFKVAFSYNIVSAHRTPDRLYEFAQNAQKKGIKIIIAGAGGAAHLSGMIASLTTLPVLGVPISNTSLNGIDSLYSTVQMPKGIPVATFAIGKSGAANAAIFAISILALRNDNLMRSLKKWKEKQTESVPYTVDL